jgi:hypothetical protein
MINIIKPRIINDTESVINEPYFIAGAHALFRASSDS